MEDRGITLARAWEAHGDRSGARQSAGVRSRVMLPPEPGPEGSEPGRAPVRRARTVGRRGRPLSLVVAILLFAAFWICSVGTAMWGLAHDRKGGHGGDVAYIVFWTLVFALMVWRLWRGGRVAIAFMSRVGTLIGGLCVVATVAFAVLFATDPPGGSALDFVPYLLPTPVAGVALLTAGLLLRRREVSRWSGF
ncbi:hypothetical protein Airi02_022370 [Actinoallomurus iriomotensis]|uniref:Uncharacterized protein n=2 Tax=Actinoallomurus iriomotensis TaxID=478107 RepID=A0A9W6VTB6_9ACTN|nr:hypothetical protein Airi02_022370 [Actinoallomurus iriomotensis]